MTTLSPIASLLVIFTSATPAGLKESIKHRCNNGYYFIEKTKPNPRNAKADREKVLRRNAVEDHQEAKRIEREMEWEI